MARDKRKISKRLYYYVWISFAFPVIYILFRLFKGDSSKLRSDYVLMLLQCLVGLLVIHVPSFMEKRLSREIPVDLTIMYLIFLYCAIFLGEVRSFYYRFPWWDVLLHFMSSMLTGIFSLILIVTLNKHDNVAMKLSPVFVAIFVFSFSMMIGAVWEIYEYLADGILHTNMQKFMTAGGTILSGHQALSDTMKDIMVDGVGAFLSAAIGYLLSNHDNK